MGRIRVGRIAGSSESTEQVSRGAGGGGGLGWQALRRERMYKNARPPERFGQRSGGERTFARIWRVTENLLDQSPGREIKNLAERNLLVSERSGIGSKGVERVFSVGQSPEVILLRCYNNYPYSSLRPSCIPVKNLRVLGIQTSELVTLWEHESEAPLQLRELQIHSSLMVKVPESIGKLKQLEKIVLWCHSDTEGLHLENLPDEFSQLQSLKFLRLIRMFPKMKSLPDSFGNLTNLQHLDLVRCTGLKMLPDSFGNLTKLQHIDLTMCQKLQMLPNSFGNLIHLKFLILRECEQLAISSETLGKITRLEYLNLRWCEKIKVFPPQLTCQRFLREMHLVSDFKELPSAIGNLSNLKILELQSSCLEILPPSLGNIRSLEELNLKVCPFKYFPDSTRMLTQLKRLTLWYMNNLERLEIEECPSRELAFKTDEAAQTETPNDSRGKEALNKLDASKGSYLKAVLPNLQYLEIRYCDRLVEVVPSTTLTEIRLHSCPRLKKIGGLLTLAKLLVHNVDCPELEWPPVYQTCL